MDHFYLVSAHSIIHPLAKEIIIGTRGSELALWQANHVRDQLISLGNTCSLQIIKTQGDRIQHLSLDKLEGKGFFTKELEDALLNKEIDIAVHSHKDLETDQPAGLVIAAVSERADPSELLLIHPAALDISRPFHFREGARVGTSSARRKSQILHWRPDVELADIRGNVTTRVQKLRDGMFEAILLAKAGIDRLDLDTGELTRHVIDPYTFVPAPAQGVLAMQCRADDESVISALAPLNNELTRKTIHIERNVLNRMKGGCHLPLGIYAELLEGQFHAHVSIAFKWDSPVRQFKMQDIDADNLVERILEEINR